VCWGSPLSLLHLSLEQDVLVDLARLILIVGLFSDHVDHESFGELLHSKFKTLDLFGQWSVNIGSRREVHIF
jgi:hypothetical protein